MQKHVSLLHDAEGLDLHVAFHDELESLEMHRERETRAEADLSLTLFPHPGEKLDIGLLGPLHFRPASTLHDHRWLHRWLHDATLECWARGSSESTLVDRLDLFFSFQHEETTTQPLALSREIIRSLHPALAFVGAVPEAWFGDESSLTAVDAWTSFLLNQVSATKQPVELWVHERWPQSALFVSEGEAVGEYLVFSTLGIPSYRSLGKSKHSEIESNRQAMRQRLLETGRQLPELSSFLGLSKK